MSTDRFFDSPEQAVDRISDLLRKEDWATLARYYDLAGTGVDRSTLESGEFFIARERPPIAHPAGFWRYRHPFPPGFRYDSHEVTGDVAVVRVSIAIDQGDGMNQRGMHVFRMKKSPHGWRILAEDIP